MTVRTRAELNSDADTNLADNTTGDISAADVRSQAKNQADSGLLAEDIGVSVQAYSANLAEWSGINPSANGGSLVAAADYAAMRGLLGVSKVVAVFTPLNNQPPASNFATLDTRNSRPVLDFDTTTQEAAIFTGVIPADYNSAGLSVTIEASLTSATSGTLGWDAAFETATGLDIDSDSFATAQVGTAATVPATSGQPMRHTIAFSNSQIDGLAAGDTFRLRIRRDVTNDNAAGDAELISVKVEVT